MIFFLVLGSTLAFVACGGDGDGEPAATGTASALLTGTAIVVSDPDAPPDGAAGGNGPGGGGGSGNDNDRSLPPPALSRADLPEGWEIARGSVLNFTPPRRGPRAGQLGAQEQALRDHYGSGLEDGLYQRLRTQAHLPSMSADVEVLAFASTALAAEGLLASQTPADLAAGATLGWAPEGGTAALVGMSDPAKPEQTIYRASLQVNQLLIVVTFRTQVPDTGPELATDLATRVYNRLPATLRD